MISNDRGVRNDALRIGMIAMSIQELELPESARQMDLVPPIKTPPKVKVARLKVIGPVPRPEPEA